MVAVLFSAGLQLPVIPLLEVVGKGLRVLPLQIGATCVNVGLTIGLTTMVMVVVVAHCPGLGVKVYVVVALLFATGLQVPCIPFSEVVGIGLILLPRHTDGSWVN